MAFDQSTRNRLARFVSDARRTLTDEFTRQCKQDYGFDPDTGEVSDVARLTHLNDTQRATAHILRETLDHYVAGSPSGGKKASIDRILREQAFTTLNRLCAVRMAEARGIVIESVGKGPQSKGFSLYARVAGSALGETADAYRGYLFSIFDELALDLPPLFDRFSPKGRLFPSATALDSLLSEINHVDLDPLWGEDETIGWLYQYFNSIEERKQMRDESAAPRNSRELAVRNQFFTPRYVVEFLTDNTLGRIWYEMTRGETVLKDTCRYLVRRPSEIFMAEGQEAPAQEQAPDNLSQEELLKQPVHIPHRPLKDPREIRLLDPACGSMHFGLYAFDLFTTIYDEAWELARGPADTRPQSTAFAEFIAFAATFPDKAAFMREVPRLIIEHNIHGIDIDPRAVQIAGLSLWLRAQRTWHQVGVKPAERPRITRSHIVCAEPMPGEKALLQEFVQQQFQEGERPVFGFLLEQVFDQMKLAGEAGSVLRIEESIRTSIAEAKRRWREGPKYEQSPLFAEAVAKPGQGQMRLDLSGITDEQFWERAEQRIYDALKAYSEKAENGGGFQRRLFANDAAQGFAFIDLSRESYDVVVMNPPFGEQSDSVRPLLERQCSSYGGEFGLAFLSRFAHHHFVGSVLPRPILLRKRYADFRENALDRVDAILDLGWGVLDGAQLEVTAQVHSSRASAFVSAIDAYADPLENKEAIALTAIQMVRGTARGDRFYSPLRASLSSFPNRAIVYKIPSSLLAWFRNSRLDTLAKCLRGLQPPKSEAYFYAWYEVPLDHSDSWKPICNGGGFSPFWIDNKLVTRWGPGGKSVVEHPKGSATNASMYFQPGICWSKRAERLYFAVFPAGHIFTHEGHAAFPSAADRMWLLGLLNSRAAAFLINSYCGLHKQAGYVRQIPIPQLPQSAKAQLEQAAREMWTAASAEGRSDETSRSFVSPLPQTDGSQLTQTFDEVFRRIDEIVETSTGLPDDTRAFLKAYWAGAIRVETVDEEASDSEDGDEPSSTRVPLWLRESTTDSEESRLVSYCVGCAFGRWDIRYATGKKLPPEPTDPYGSLPTCPPGMLQSDAGLPVTAQVGVGLGQGGGYPIDVNWDGMLVHDLGHPLDIERCVRVALSVIWGDSAELSEQALCESLGEPTLREWFRRPSSFFADHLKRYSKSRRQAPIYWPLSTPSVSYTLWLYYHRLTDQTLFKAVNDFVEPKLQQIASQAAALRSRTSRSSADNAELERLSDFEIELTEFRDELLRLAKVWKPNLNDGVVITAAPLWKLFQYKPWQKKLKETWEALEAGEYDWAHLAYSLWPDRVREKCKHDKSLAIAHGLEELYQEPPATAGKKRGRKPKVVDPELMEEAE